MTEYINSNVYNIIDIALKDGQKLHFENCVNIKIPLGYMKFNLNDEYTTICIDNYSIKSVDIEETDNPYMPKDDKPILYSKLDLYYKGYKADDSDHFSECQGFEFDTEVFKFKCKNERGAQCYHKGQIREIYMFKKVDVPNPYEIKEVEGVPCKVIASKEGDALNYKIYGNKSKITSPKNLYGFNDDKTETANGVTCTYSKNTGIFTFNGKMDKKGEYTNLLSLDNVLKTEPNITYQLHAYYAGGTISGEFPPYSGGLWIVPRGQRKYGSGFAYGMILDKFGIDKPMNVEKFTTDSELESSSMDFSLSDDCLLEFNNFQVKIMLEVADEPTEYEKFGADYNYVGKLIGDEKYIVKVNDTNIVLPKQLTNSTEYTDYEQQAICSTKGNISCDIPPFPLNEGDNTVMTNTAVNPSNIYVKYEQIALTD